MAFHGRTVSFFFSICVANFITQDVILLKNIYMTNCRIAGVALVAAKNGTNFNFAEAKTVCRQLGLTLAQKSKIEAAWKHGFETCSFGWVAEGYAVISRVTPNEKCGQNKTGISSWRMKLDRKARVYCYNSSDTWINSCIPEQSTVALPDSSTEMKSTVTASFQDTTRGFDTTPLLKTPKSPKYRIICVTETLPSEPTPEKENRLFTEKRTAFKNEGVPFGGNRHTQCCECHGFMLEQGSPTPFRRPGHSMPSTGPHKQAKPHPRDALNIQNQTPFGLWKNLSPHNRSLVPKRLGISVLNRRQRKTSGLKFLLA
ncbi:lymphatic vessel endothelial hyaluronic acid receptor 1-like [Crotalus tigris]|uniref:lymphatic vessel endothelial hyaluronic acid receptor 1-like n=1 Tax=Crotalus tigris TaxID=88082 RepID=UPI00192F2114|nr:lymphatic vessel endothelial hyaluronic acid receptor 1-like [Crotalus tigris]